MWVFINFATDDLIYREGWAVRHNKLGLLVATIMEQLEIRYNFYCLDFCYHEESTLFCRVNSWDIAVEK